MPKSIVTVGLCTGNLARGNHARCARAVLNDHRLGQRAAELFRKKSGRNVSNASRTKSDQYCYGVGSAILALLLYLPWPTATWSRRGTNVSEWQTDSCQLFLLIPPTAAR